MAAWNAIVTVRVRMILRVSVGMPAVLRMVVAARNTVVTVRVLARNARLDVAVRRGWFRCRLFGLRRRLEFALVVFRHGAKRLFE